MDFDATDGVAAAQQHAQALDEVRGPFLNARDLRSALALVICALTA